MSPKKTHRIQRSIHGSVGVVWWKDVENGVANEIGSSIFLQKKTELLQMLEVFFEVKNIDPEGKKFDKGLLL